MRSKRFVVLLVIVAIVGVIVSLATWCFLELIYQIQRELWTHLPHALGYNNGPPLWWGLPVLALAGLFVALAITRLPGDGGHLPARGLAVGGKPVSPIDLPGVVLAGLAAISSGLVIGPEAPLIAIGAGVALLCIKLARRQTPPQVLVLVAAAGSFAALSFIFDSPLIAAVILIEATGIGGPRLPLLLLPGLLAAGIGTLVSIGMGSFTGLSSSAYALGPLALPHFAHPTVGQFGWTIAMAIAIAAVTRAIMVGGLSTYGVVARRLLLFLPLVGLIIAGLAIAFHGATGKNVERGPVLRPGRTSRAHRAGRNMVGRRAPAADLDQGHRLQPVARQLSRRPDIPGDISGSRRGSRGLAPPRLRTGAGGWRRDRRRDRGRTPATAVGRRPCHVADRQVRHRRRAADHRRCRRRVPGHAAALAQALRVRPDGQAGSAPTASSEQTASSASP